MPVQRNHCSWPTCYEQTTLLPLVGLDGYIHVACPFHHQWILLDIDKWKPEKAHVPVEERKAPSGPFDNLVNPFTVWCDKPDCWYRVAAPTYEEGVRVYTAHKCPYSSPSRGFIVSLTVIQKCWIKLDSALIELLEGSYPPIATDESEDSDFREHPEKIRLKGVCRGMAEMIAEFMAPHWTADDVSAEAGKRYKAKKAGEDYETPGLVATLAKPRTVEYKDSVNKSGAPAAPAKPAHKFTDEEVGSIKFASESGMFTKEQLAKTYKVTVAVIDKVLTS